jgi:hypothetical protein
VLPRLDRRGERLDSLPGRVPGPDTKFWPAVASPSVARWYSRAAEQETPAFHEAGARAFFTLPSGQNPITVEAIQQNPGLLATDSPESASTASGPVKCVLEVSDLGVHFPIRKGC